MANRNNNNFDLDSTNGPLDIITSDIQPTSNFPQMDGFLRQSILAVTADATVANTTTETSLVGTTSGTNIFPIDFLATARTIQFRTEGYISNTGTPTLRLKFYIGTTAIVDTGAQSMSTISGSQRWVFDGTITCRTTGGTGTVQAQGELRYWTNATSVIGISTVTTSPIVIDTTIIQVVDITAQWGTSSASNTITSSDVVVETMM